MQAALAVDYPPTIQIVRDDAWLSDLHGEIWDRYFSDTPRANVVHLSFGPAWKTRLGLITMSLDAATSYIVVNGLLRHPAIPEFVIAVTVAHEMVHYAHGFGSPLPQRYKHPHRGGIVKRELFRRGMVDEYERYDDWVYRHWYDFCDEQMCRPGQDVRPIKD